MNISPVSALSDFAAVQPLPGPLTRSVFSADAQARASPMTSGRPRAQPPVVADELRRQMDIFTDLVELRTKVGRDPPSVQRDASAHDVRGSHSPSARPPHAPAGT